MPALAVLGVLGVLATMLTACGGDSATTTSTSGTEVTSTTAGSGGENEEGTFDWRRFEGEEITLLLVEHPWSNAMEPAIDEFESLTGIKVDVQTFSEDLYFDRSEEALRASDGLADVYFQPMDSMAFTQYGNGLLASIGPFLRDASLTAPGYDEADFGATINAAEFPVGSPDAEVYGIPISTETYIVFYNKDIVDEYLDGVFPSTVEGLIEAAETITAESDGSVSGAVVRGVRTSVYVPTIASFVMNEIADPSRFALPYSVWFDGDFNAPTLTDPLVIEGVDQYARLVATGPENRLAIDWPEAVALFSQGRAGFFIDASVFGPTFEDPDQSLIAGRVGYALIPPSERGQATGLWSWGLGIPANSQHKEAAWYFIQWATNKENTARFGVATGGAPRISASESSEYLAAFNPEFVAVAGEALQIAWPASVYLDTWPQHALSVVDAVHSIVGGEDPAVAMERANDEIKATAGG